MGYVSINYRILCGGISLVWFSNFTWVNAIKDQGGRMIEIKDPTIMMIILGTIGGLFFMGLGKLIQLVNGGNKDD